MNEITTNKGKKYTMQLMGDKSVVLSKQEAERLMNFLEKENPKFIRVGDEMFATHQIVKIGRGGDEIWV